MVEGGGLENRWGLTAPGGSNPSSSAIIHVQVYYYHDIARLLIPIVLLSVLLSNRD